MWTWRCVPASGFPPAGSIISADWTRCAIACSALLGCDVDLVEETAARARLRQVIEREGVRAF